MSNLSENILSFLSEANRYEKWLNSQGMTQALSHLSSVGDKLGGRIVDRYIEKNNIPKFGLWAAKRSERAHKLSTGEKKYPNREPVSDDASISDIRKNGPSNRQEAVKMGEVNSSLHPKPNQSKHSFFYDLKQGLKGATTRKTTLSANIGNKIGRSVHFVKENPGKIAAIGAGGLAAKHFLGKKSLVDKATGYVKKNPGKVAGASLAALGAGAGAAALIRYLRKKRKQG